MRRYTRAQAKPAGICPSNPPVYPCSPPLYPYPSIRIEGDYRGSRGVYRGCRGGVEGDMARPGRAQPRDGLETGEFVLAFAGAGPTGLEMRAEMVWGQAAPAVDLLHGLDKDALPGGQQAGFDEVGAGDVGQAAFQVGEPAQDAVRRVRSLAGCWTRKVLSARRKALPTSIHQVNASLTSLRVHLRWL